MLGITSRLLLIATLAAGVAAAPSVREAEWVYWITNHVKPDDGAARGASLEPCSVEVGRMPYEGYTVELHRAPYASACVGSVKVVHANELMRGPGEVVLFLPETMERATGEMDWSARLGSAMSSAPSAAAGQVAFQLAAPRSPILAATHDVFAVALDEAGLATADRWANFDTRLHRVDFRPTNTLQLNEEDRPEPVFGKPKHNALVSKIASSSALNPARIVKDLRILTGEDAQPAEVGEWHSRHSSTYGARRAAQWIKQQLESSLAPLNASCDYFNYSAYFSPNVVCDIRAPSSQGEEEGEMVLISAHYDSRGTFGSTTAPGGDDDGSGTAALLAIARAVGQAAVSFDSPVRLVAFSGEEQGLVGSQMYAKHLRDTNVKVKFALQMDMLAYRKPGEPMQIAFPDKLATKSATQFVWRIADIYAPELEQGYTPACCSDHQSFWEAGYPATWVFERNGPIADPMYHNSGDTTDREGYDVNQLAAIAKVVTASLLHLAGFNL